MTSGTLAGEELSHRLDAVAHLLGEPRVPLEFLERLASPLPSAVQGQCEAVALEWLDQEVGHRAVSGRALDELGVAGREHHGGVRVVAPDLAREPQAVLPRHHDVDDGEIGVARVERVERRLRVGGGARLQAERCDPSRHQISHGGLIVHDEHGSRWRHGR